MPSRRQLLGACGCGLAAVAGCAGCPGPTDTPASDTPTPDTASDTPTTDTPSQPDRLRIEDGTVAWRQSLADAVVTNPVSTGNTLVVLAGSTLRGIDTKTGETRWQLPTNVSAPDSDRVTGTLAVHAGNVYAIVGRSFGTGAADYVVIAVTPDGTERWRTATEVGGFHTLVGFGDGAIVIATSDDAIAPDPEHAVFALELASGDRRWTAQAGDAAGGAVTDRLAVVEAFGAAYGFGMGGGDERFRFQPDDTDIESVAAGGSRAFVALSSFDAPDDAPSLVAIGEDGTRDWERAKRETGIVTSLRYEEDLYVGGERVRRLAPDGTERWTADVGGLLTGVPFDREAAYVNSDASLVALSRADGRSRWTAPVSDLAIPRARGGDTVVSTDGRQAVAFGHDRRNGERLWRAVYPNERPVDPVADANGTYLVTESGEVIAVTA